MNRLLKEPLLHFLLIGAVLFMVYGLFVKPSGGERGEIIVTQGQIEALATAFAKTWQRPPTSDELTGSIRAQVREEVYAREAVAMGLDRDDPVIRRRLQQKLEFISNDLVAERQATDAELDAYLQAHPEVFRAEARFTFRQVYLNPEKHRSTLERDAKRLLDQLNNLNSKADPATSGDATMLEHSLVALRSGDVAKMFGDVFAAQIDKLTPGQWQGPIESGYGLHLVLIDERVAGGLPKLDQVRDAVQREWANAQRLAANESFYQALLKRYQVTIEDRVVSTATAAVGK
jgi:hypothetical protein